MTGPSGHPTTSIVIPAYNEQARFAALLTALGRDAERELDRAGLSYLEAVIVDDGSTDGTRSLLERAAADEPRINPVFGKRNRGKGAAIRDGVAAARGDWVLIVDVDLSTPIRDVRGLAEEARRAGAEIAIGSRDRHGSNVIAPLRRRLVGTLFNLAVRGATGLDYADTQSGFKLARTTVARELLTEQLCPGFAFDVELLLRARLAGLEVVEVPVSYTHDHGSKVRILTVAPVMARDLGRLWWRLRRPAKGAAAPPVGGERSAEPR